MARSNRPRPIAIEPLEARSLLAAIVEFPIDGSLRSPLEITAGANADLWFTASGTNNLGHITADGTITPIKGSLDPLTAIATLGDGTVWMQGVRYRVVVNPNHRPGIIYPPGFEGNDFLYYRELSFFQLNSSAGQIESTAAAKYSGDLIAAGGAQLWVSFPDSRKLSLYDTTVEFYGDRPHPILLAAIPTDAASPKPQHLTLADPANPSAGVWFSEIVVDQGGQPIGGRIGRVGVTTPFQDYAIPSPSSTIGGLVVGRDGNLWFTETEANKIGRMSPDGVSVEWALPTLGAKPGRIVAGPDGNLWFTETGSSKIGRITPSGVITEVATPTHNSQPTGLAVEPDGMIWFTEASSWQIGKLDPSAVAAAPIVVPPIVVPPIVLIGARLDPASDTSSGDGVTSNNHPSFRGTAAPGAKVEIFATPVGPTSTGRTSLGSTVADAQGAWRVVSLALADGRYNLEAVATGADGTSQTMPVTTALARSVLVVDTVGPTLTAISVDVKAGSVSLTFADQGLGLTEAMLIDRSHYTLTIGTGRSALHYKLTGAMLATVTSVESKTVVLTFNHGRRLLPAFRTMLTVSARGFTDTAGNALNGGYPGGDVRVRMVIAPRRLLAIRTVPVPKPPHLALRSAKQVY